MQKNSNSSISLEVYVNLLNTGQLYKGYVENCGYATYEAVPVSTYVNKSDLAYNLRYVCKLNISPDERRKSSNVYYSNNQYDDSWFTPDNVLKATTALSIALVADDVTVVGAVDDVAIPFIWVAGGLCYIVAVLQYKNVGSGNDNYPGPWCETQIPKTNFMMQPAPPPTDPEDFSKGGKPWFAVGMAYAIHDTYQVIYGSDPTSAMAKKAEERNIQANAPQRKNGQQYYFTPNFSQRGLSPIRQVNRFKIARIIDEIYSKTHTILKDNTNVVTSPHIEPILRTKK